MATEFLLGIALTWVLCGLFTAFAMRRRGHDFLVWLAIGVVLGPLVIPIAIEKARHDPEVDSDFQRREYPGAFDVLVGLDHSHDSAQALRSAIALFGDQLSSVTLATVLDYESHESYSGAQSREEAEEFLTKAAASVSHPDVRTEVLFGRPDRALTEFAKSNHVELIVVGPRGHGASEAMFGSVTRSLVSDSEVPVYVGKVNDPVRLPQMRPD